LYTRGNRRRKGEKVGNPKKGGGREGKNKKEERKGKVREELRYWRKGGRSVWSVKKRGGGRVRLGGGGRVERSGVRS
jgi:hypothetical protein